MGTGTSPAARMFLHFCRIIVVPQDIKEKVPPYLLFNKQAIGLLFSLWFIAGINGVAQQLASKAVKQPYSLEVTPKLHSGGHSLYTGTYLNHHLNLEMNVTFKYKQMGAFMSKYADFADTHSAINYSTFGFFRSFQLSESVKLTPYVGYSFNQANSFMDKGSDLWVGLVTRLNINEHLWIENTSLVANMLHHNGATTSLANRLNGAVLIGNFRLDAYAWYTHSSHSAHHFVSASLALTSPEWILAPTVSMKVQVSVLQQITEERPETFDRGVLISLIVPIDCSPK